MPARAWGFKSPLGHTHTFELRKVIVLDQERRVQVGARRLARGQPAKARSDGTINCQVQSVDPMRLRAVMGPFGSWTELCQST